VRAEVYCLGDGIWEIKEDAIKSPDLAIVIFEANIVNDFGTLLTISMTIFSATIMASSLTMAELDPGRLANQIHTGHHQQIGSQPMQKKTEAILDGFSVTSMKNSFAQSLPSYLRCLKMQG
jgi:hypothetical protein